MPAPNPSNHAPFNGLELSAFIQDAKHAQDPEQIGALLSLYRNYLSLLARTQINDKLKSFLEPSDVVQETYLDAIQGFSKVVGQTEAELMAWLRKILARNICDYARKVSAQCRDVNRERSLEMSLDRSSINLVNALGGTGLSPSTQAVQREQAVLVADAIANLPPEYRQVILMRQIHGIPFPEIAERMDRSPGAVRMLWLRALESLKKAIDWYEQ